MALLERLIGASAVAIMAIALGTVPVSANLKPAAPPPHLRRLPEVFQVSPTTVNPRIQSNLMIVGNYLTPTTRVMVGEHPATTVEAAADHLLIALPPDLSNGTYLIQLTNETGTTTAQDRIVIDNSQPGLNNSTLLAAGGLLLLLVLVMRLARSPIPTI